jgi:hypothetical protein
LPQQNNGKTMALHAVATHFKYGIQRPPWQRHELSSVISLSFLDVYGFPTTTLPPSLHMRLLTSFSPDGHTDRDQLKIKNGSKRKRLCDADQK